MHFRCTCEVVGLATHFKETNKLEFRFDTSRSILILLSKNYPDGLKPLDSSALVCISSTTAEITDAEIASQLKIAVATSIDGRWANFKDPSALIFFDSVTGELQSVMASTLSLLRWREGLAEAPPDPCFNRKEFLSEDGETWREVSRLRGIKIRFGIATGPTTPANELSKEIVHFVKAGMEEPLGRQLFREAWSLRLSQK